MAVQHADGRERQLINGQKNTFFTSKWTSPAGVKLEHTTKVKADGTWSFQTRADGKLVDAGHGRKGPYAKMRSPQARRAWLMFRKR